MCADGKITSPDRGREGAWEGGRQGLGPRCRRAAAARSRSRLSATNWVGSKRGGRDNGADRGRCGDGTAEADEPFESTAPTRTDGSR